jgi:hypothetical protein
LREKGDTMFRTIFLNKCMSTKESIIYKFCYIRVASTAREFHNLRDWELCRYSTDWWVAMVWFPSREEFPFLIALSGMACDTFLVQDLAWTRGCCQSSIYWLGQLIRIICCLIWCWIIGMCWYVVIFYL